MKVSTKIGGSFFLLSLFVLIAGIAGYYGIHRLSQSLDFVTQNAWDAADGSMEAVIGIQHQMIALEHIISHIEVLNEQEEATFKTLLNTGQSAMTTAIKEMIDSGLISNQEMTQLNNQLPKFLEQQKVLLATHQRYRSVRMHFNENRLHFFQSLTTVETFVYDTANQLNNQLELLELKRTAVDNIRELRSHLLERFLYFEQWMLGEQEPQYLQASMDACKY